MIKILITLLLFVQGLCAKEVIEENTKIYRFADNGEDSSFEKWIKYLEMTKTKSIVDLENKQVWISIREIQKGTIVAHIQVVDPELDYNYSMVIEGKNTDLLKDSIKGSISFHQIYVGKVCISSAGIQRISKAGVIDKFYIEINIKNKDGTKERILFKLVPK